VQGPGGVDVSYTYDSAGRMLTRVSGGVTTTFEWDGWTLVKETTGSTVTRYIAPQGQLHSFERGGQVYQVHSDGHNGSVRAITDASGAVVAHYELDAWGAQLGSSSPFSGGFAFGYVGSLGVRTDATTGLLYMRHRWFDPNGLQRFISRDPVKKPNLYIYANNQPPSVVDPSGLEYTSYTNDWQNYGFPGVWQYTAFHMRPQVIQPFVINVPTWYKQTDIDAFANEYQRWAKTYSGLLAHERYFRDNPNNLSWEHCNQELQNLYKLQEDAREIMSVYNYLRNLKPFPDDAGGSSLITGSFQGFTFQATMGMGLGGHLTVADWHLYGGIGANVGMPGVGIGPVSTYTPGRMFPQMRSDVSSIMQKGSWGISGASPFAIGGHFSGSSSGNAAGLFFGSPGVAGGYTYSWRLF
jgi:RHS repeat-associated protein